MTKNDDKSRWRKFGEWVREERLAIISPTTKQQLSQIEAAERAGLSRVQWARIEAGASGTKYTTIPLIARGIGYNTPDKLAEVYKRAGFATDQEAVKLPASMRHFIELPIEIQREIARQVEREYERLQLKKEKRGK